MKSTVYHVGRLVHDRRRDTDLDKMARELWYACERGDVLLFQRRAGLGVFAYH